MFGKIVHAEVEYVIDLTPAAKKIRDDFFWLQQSSTIRNFEAEIKKYFPQKKDFLDPNPRKEIIETTDNLRRICKRLGPDIVESGVFQTLANTIITTAGWTMRTALEPLLALYNLKGKEQNPLLSEQSFIRMLEQMIYVAPVETAQTLMTAIAIANRNIALWQSREVQETIAQIYSVVPNKRDALTIFLQMLDFMSQNLSPVLSNHQRTTTDVLKTVHLIAMTAPKEFTEVLHQALFVSKPQAKDWRRALKEKRFFCLRYELGNDPRFYSLVRDNIWRYVGGGMGHGAKALETLRTSLNTPWVEFRLKNSTIFYADSHS